jgi:transposase
VLWVVVTPVVTVFTIATSRASRVLKDLLGEPFAGYLVSDRWSAYGWVPAAQRQVCWSHLARNFQGLADRGGAATEIGKPAVALTKELFAAWHAFRDDHHNREVLAEAMYPVQKQFRGRLKAGTSNADDKTQGLCWSLLDLWPALWLFVTREGVEPTNNVAERALRPAVLWRKGSFGTQSDGGARFVERLLTVAMPCRQQGRSLLEYLTAVCTAAQCCHTIPSLLPATASAQGP